MPTPRTFEEYATYRTQRRAEIGEPPETEGILKRSYRSYLTATKFAGDDVDIVFEKRANSPAKVVFVPRSALHRVSLG
jgi:hypothetical protein